MRKSKSVSRLFFPHIIKRAALRAELEKKRLTVMFQDEARFGRITLVSDCWAPHGMRPRVPQQAIREYTYAYAAVSPATGALDTLILPNMAGGTLGVFLAELSKRRPKELVLLVLDGAPCHHSKTTLKVPENIQLCFLPPYSPELNPTENLWDELREKFFRNTAFKNMTAVEKQLVKGLMALENSPKTVQSIAGFPWIMETLNSLA
jgi:transposase